MSILSTGTIGALNATLDATSLDSVGSTSILITGTWVGTATFQGSLDGTTFVDMLGVQISNAQITSTTAANGSFLINTFGLKTLRVKMTAYSSGTATVTMQSANGLAFQNVLAVMSGATDSTRIGNNGDRLKVDAAFASTVTTVPGIVKLAYDDMNASNGGVARGTAITTSYTTIYNRSGAGYVFGFSVSFEGNIIGADEFILKFIVDGLTVAEISTADIGTNALYAAGSDGDALIWGFQTANNNLMFKAPGTGALRYASTVQIQIKKASGSNKQFRAGVIGLTKE